MKKESKTKILKIIIILSIIGLVVSLYLVKNHYADPTKGSLCDMSESISCSLVNTSTFSELFNVPVALLGVLWFLVLIIFSWKALKKDGALLAMMLGWGILGILFVIYFVIAEIILRSICPFCTLVHVIVIAIFILLWVLYRAQEIKPTKNAILKALMPWIILIILINIIPLVLFNISSSEKEDYSALAQCITEKGVNMYGSFRCGVCAKTRAMFGDSFKYINEIECHPQGENAQTELCLEKGIEGTPTWILEPDGVELKRQLGFLSIEELKEFSGCE